MKPKFRVWDKKLQTMLDVSLIDFKKGVLVGEHWEFGETNFMSFDEIVIMQTTGLLDKKGVEIFEGDIISDGNTSRDIRHQQTLGFYTIDGNGVEGFFGDTASLEDFEEVSKYMSENIEIIGNIYENPELLEMENGL